MRTTVTLRLATEKETESCLTVLLLLTFPSGREGHGKGRSCSQKTFRDIDRYSIKKGLLHSLASPFKKEFAFMGKGYNQLTASSCSISEFISAFQWRPYYLLGQFLLFSLILCNLMDCILLGSPVHGISQARALEQAAISFIQGIFPTQGLNLHFLHRQADSLPLSHQGSLSSSQPVTKYSGYSRTQPFLLIRSFCS